MGEGTVAVRKLGQKLKRRAGSGKADCSVVKIVGHEMLEVLECQPGGDSRRVAAKRSRPGKIR